MKGIVFSEFLELVEAKFGYDIVEQILEAANVPSGGAYTAVGTYDHSEIVKLVSELSRITQTSLPDLLGIFGEHLFGTFVLRYPEMFEGVDGAFTFLRKIENHIHVEVRKLYPDADLPSFEYSDDGPGRLVMTYRSHRGMADLAFGLIRGCAAHFKEQLQIEQEDLSEGHRTAVRFVITQSPA